MIKNSKRNADSSQSSEVKPKKSIKMDKSVFNFSRLKKGQPKPKGMQFYNEPRVRNYNSTEEKPDWNKLKERKKQLRLKRKQNNDLYDISTEAKQIAELLRQKQLTGGKNERDKLVAQLHSLLGGKGNYAKFGLTHDMARIVQYMLKFGSENIRNDIAKELIPVTVKILQSKYGKYCLKNMFKYGNSETRAASIKCMYGNAKQLTGHVVSATIFEYIYSTWTSQQQKYHLIQEFYGNIYKHTKDDQVKHLKDVYKNSPNMKNAAIQATKANLSNVLNKKLLDSGLIQSVLYQFLTECSIEDKTELISQLSPHIVVISNSKDGAKTAMMCIWHGNNKDKKVAMKAIKEHVNELCKHEYGHCSIIALLDAVDDTVLVNKMLLSQMLSDVDDLVVNDWGRKVLLWLVAPAESTHFHPLFIKELEIGRANSTSKKSVEMRRDELLNYTIPSLLNRIESNPQFWLSTASIAILTVAILKSDSNANTEKALEGIAKTVAHVDWKVKENEKEVLGIEHAGLHMILKKLAQFDKVAAAANKPSFGKALLDVVSDETLALWVTLNRGCFLLVFIYENGTESVRHGFKLKLIPHQLKLLKKQKSAGSNILLKKLE